jgi:hypothetical protein
VDLVIRRKAKPERQRRVLLDTGLRRYDEDAEQVCVLTSAGNALIGYFYHIH